MTSRRDTILAVARCPRAPVTGQFERHVGRSVRDLAGSQAGGRWGPPGAFSVLYLGRPRQSVVVEAYRHLVEPLEGMTGDMVQTRKLFRVEVDVTTILDLRTPAARSELGLSEDELRSPVGAYERCWEVARAAHQLELHGIIAPAATNMGETLALFEQHLPVSEAPRLVGEEIWTQLPADPRRLRLVDDSTA